LTKKDGVVLEGNFINGKLEGPGKCTFANKDIYTGDFKASKPDG
jgi:hypothetical protein